MERELEETSTPKYPNVGVDNARDILMPETKFGYCSGRGSNPRELQDQGCENLTRPQTKVKRGQGSQSLLTFARGLRFSNSTFFSFCDFRFVFI